jgi:HK97 family phage major capsid protein
MDRIQQLRARRTAGLEDMEKLIGASAAESRDLTADETAKLDGLKAADDKFAAEIATLEDLERRKAAAAKPIAALPGAVPSPALPAQPKAADQKGLKFARQFRCLAAAGGVPFVAAQIAESWGDSGLFANQNIATGSAGGFLVEEDVASEVIELLRPASVVMSLNPIVVPMPSGNMTMNRRATGSSAAYIGEQQAAPSTGVTFGQVKLSAKKLAALIPISNDLLRSSGTAIDQIVRDDLVASLAQRGDLAFIRGAGTEFSPKGLRFQTLGTSFATTHVLAQSGSTVAAVKSDLARLELALTNADIPMLRPGWLMAPRTESFLKNLTDANNNTVFPEMERGQLRSKPYRITTQIPVNLGGGTNESELYLADFAQVVVGEHMGIEVAMSTEAAYIDANSTMQAAFSRDETLMRAIQQHDIGMRHLAGVAILTAVTWTP